MPHKIYSLLGITFLTFFSNQVFAKNYSIGVKAGTLGIGLELTKPVQDSLDFRIGINHFEAQVSNFRIGSIEYDVKASANSINALIDWYPKQNKKFYVSGGFLLGNDHIKPKPTPNFVYQGIKIGQALDRFAVNLKVDYADVAPYFSIGYSNKASHKKGWYYAADLGFAYLGKPKTDFNIIDKTTGKTPTIIPEGALEGELAKVNKKLQDYKVWPVLSLTWNYHF